MSKASKNSVTFPRSLSKYFADAAWRQSIQTLLEHSATDYPVNLDWSDQISYHEAYVAAQITRLEHHKVLLEVWETCWGDPKSFDNLGFGFETRDTKTKMDPYHTWEDGIIRRWDLKNGQYLYLYSWVFDEDNESTGPFYIWAGAFVSFSDKRDDEFHSEIKAKLIAIEGVELFEEEVRVRHAPEPLEFIEDGETGPIDLSLLVGTCGKLLKVLSEGA